MNFRDLGVTADICSRLAELAITTPTPIQGEVIAAALRGESIVARSQTGSGKTLAYLMPIIQNHTAGEQSLILAPTRELARQIGDVLQRVSSLRCVVIYGGVEYAVQREELREKPDIIVATVGRLKDVIAQGFTTLQGVSRFVLDEVDQMLDLGFRDDILHLATLRAADAQTLALSATMPEEVKGILKAIMPVGYAQVEGDNTPLAVERIEQVGYYVTREMMDNLLLHLLRRDTPHRAIIFTRSRAMADRVAEVLCSNKIHAEAIHSERGQAAREHILARFRSGETQLLVATDIIARGIDVEGVDVVYNYGLPLEAEQYIHRIGRTARAGESGRAVTLCEPKEKGLVDRVCKLMRQHIKMTENHPYYIPEPKAKSVRRKR